MLLVMRSTLDSMAAPIDRENVERLRTFLGSNDPSLLDGEAAVVERSLLAAVTAARRLGMESVGACATLHDFYLHVHPRFDRHPAAAAVLTDPATPPDARPAVLLALATRSEWRRLCEVFDG